MLKPTRPGVAMDVRVGESVRIVAPGGDIVITLEWKHGQRSRFRVLAAEHVVIERPGRLTTGISLQP